MKIWSYIILLGLFFLSNCAKKVPLSNPASPEELIAKYQALPRSGISASFQVLSPEGFFSGELYLEKQEKVMALIYSYLPLGQPLFQLSLEDDFFLYLDFSTQTAYSNQKEWLKNYQADSAIFKIPEQVSFLAQILKALTGELAIKPEHFTSERNQLQITGKTDSGTELEYIFKKEPMHLIALNQTNAFGFQAQFSYAENCWFPTQIKFQQEEFKLIFNFFRLNCSEKIRPKFNLSIPQGFRQIFIERL